jgi:hypothetical protein
LLLLLIAQDVHPGRGDHDPLRLVNVSARYSWWRIFRCPSVADFDRPPRADETPWYLLKGKPAQRWYVWMIASTDAAYYHLDPRPSKEAARKVLDGYRGQLMVDGYDVYQKLARGSPGKPSGLVLGFCWSHVRREYHDEDVSIRSAARC